SNTYPSQWFVETKKFQQNTQGSLPTCRLLQDRWLDFSYEQRPSPIQVSTGKADQPSHRPMSYGANCAIRKVVSNPFEPTTSSRPFHNRFGCSLLKLGHFLQRGPSPCQKGSNGED